MITLSNGFSFQYLTACALGYDGLGFPHEKLLGRFGLFDPKLFANEMKTITLPPRKGNWVWWHPWTCIRPMIGGSVNAVGLTNPGYYWWTENVGPKIDSSKVAVIGSIYGEVEEIEEMADGMNSFDLVAVTLNGSCPNTQSDILRNSKKLIKQMEAVKRATRHPFGVKLGVTHDFETIVPEAKRLGVEYFEINSVPWNIVFPGKKSPLAKLGGGGVSGKIAQPFTWLFAEKLQSMTNIPVIAPSVWDFEDLAKLRAKGFKAFSFGSVFLCHPWRPTLYVKKDKKR